MRSKVKSYASFGLIFYHKRLNISTVGLSDPIVLSLILVSFRVVTKIVFVNKHLGKDIRSIIDVIILLDYSGNYSKSNQAGLC